MTYQDTLDRINGFQKFGSRLGLERMSRLMDLLGNPQNGMKVIHVAGTNGKGSVCRYLSSILQENGYKTGLYTSPFLERFTERIEFNGEEISPEDLEECTGEVLEKVAAMLEEGMDSPTEFELITAIAFHYFSKQEMDFLVLEVGLGGIGDSTNVVDHPVASVITSISYDHMEYLGDTLEKIAVEKAGIIKSGVPVISRVTDADAVRVIKKVAGEKGSRFIDACAVPFEIVSKTTDGYLFHAQIEGSSYHNLFISMVGMHQVYNAICALTVIEALKNGHIINIDVEKMYSGIARARQNGRFEIMRKKPYVIIDGAHNEAGAEALATALKEHFPKSRILMVVGMLSDKKTGKLLERFGTVSDDFIATEPDNPRKLSAEELCRQIKVTGKKCTSVKKAEDACSYALQKLPCYDVVVFAGSLYLIGKVRSILKDEKE